MPALFLNKKIHLMKHQLEIACFDLESALIAHDAGVNRIELCADLSVGGITPPWEMVLEAKEKISTDLYVMIRPRGGDFCYNDEEFEQMKNDIVSFKKMGVLGFVFGILQEDFSIDYQRNKDLIEFAYPFHCTFHRAFDRTPDLFQSLETLIELGFQTLLSSGGASNVSEGIGMLKELVDRAGDKICIMPGGGVRSINISYLIAETKARFYHSSAIVDESLLANPTEISDLNKYLTLHQ
jgi:copper homeostasis protein